MIQYTNKNAEGISPEVCAWGDGLFHGNGTPRLRSMKNCMGMNTHDGITIIPAKSQKFLR